MTPLYICLHAPEFPAQALLRLRPDLAGVPVAVLAGDPPQEQVCSVNRQAVALGVVRGQTRAELDGFAGLSVLRRSLPEERAAQLAVLEVAGTFTPRIEVQPCAPSAFTVVLDMTGSQRLFGTPEQLTGRIAGGVEGLGLFVQAAGCSNLHASVAIACSARRAPVVLCAGEERRYLEGLPLAAVALTEKQADMFALWGLQTLGELAALPVADLVARLGQEGKRLWLLARGEHPHWMVPEEPAFLLNELMGFDAPVELLESLLFVLGPMLDQLLVRAQNRSYALASVTLTLGLDGGGEHERTIKPALPVSSRETLLKLLHLDLEAHPPPAAVVSLLVHAEPGDRSKMQLGLFVPQMPEAARLDITLARIAALVGEDRVGCVRLLDTHRPNSFAMERFRVPESAPRETAVRAATALRRCRPPVRLSVEHKQGRPAGFFLRGRRYRVCEAFGPWRRSGEWWSAEVWSCEEWDVRVEAADEMLAGVVSHDLLAKAWYLEALYD